MPAEPFDLVLRGGRVIDPSLDRDEIADVGIRAGRIAAIGADLADTAAERTLDVAGKLVLPGLVDLHTHCYWGGVPLGIDADKIGPATGVTSWVDTGSAGAGNFEGFHYHVVRRSTVRIFPFLNVSHIGVLVVGGLSVSRGELFDFGYLNFHELLRVGQQFRHALYGIKVRLSLNASGPNGDDALRFARAAADALELPLMVHIGAPPPFFEQVAPHLVEGDIVTHCYTPYHGGIVDQRFNIKDAARAARDRGVLFDVGHGGGSFSFRVAEAALEQGFPPDTISTDLHSRCLGPPLIDLPTTLSKFLALGLDLPEVVARATHLPAAAIGADVGTLRPGARADIAVMRLEEGETPFADSPGVVRHGSVRLVPETTLIDGSVVLPVENDRDEASRERQFPISRLP
jgi:dihydroorotase